MTSVTVVVVSYNCDDWIARCLTSIPDGLRGRSADLIVVDNASTDSSAEMAETTCPDARLIRNPTNVGFATAVNAGVAASDCEWILLLNPDTEVRPGAIDELISFAEHHPEHGVYGGRTLRPDGSVDPSSCWKLPSLWSMVCFAFGLSTLRPRSRIFDPESMGRWQRDSVREVGVVTGCLLLTSRRVWRELGGLDTRYFVYGEDADFSARARKAGYRPAITPKAEIVHAVGISSGDSSMKMPLLLAGKVTYMRCQWSAPRQWLGSILLRAGVALRASGSRLTGRGTKWNSAWKQRDSWTKGFATPD